MARSNRTSLPALCGYQDESIAQTLPKAEFEKIHAEYMAFHDELKKSGRLLGNNGLQPTKTATTVRVREGKVTTTDGPFAETKEQLGGYFLIEARDLNEAIQVAAKIPSARFGSVESGRFGCGTIKAC